MIETSPMRATREPRRPQAPAAPTRTAAAYASDDERWDAVLARDPGAEGAFFYSVRTTGVYCRPSCASRRPRRENVAFHEGRADAERAGFRACLRCRPDQPPLAAQRAEAVARACRLIDQSEELPDLDAMAAEAGMSRFHFHRVFKDATGVTPRAYAAARRAERVRDALPASGTVTEALYGAGFGSSGRFYEASEAVLGMAPRAFRAGGEGAAIRFAVGECSLGSILVAATERGVCAISFGDDPDALVRELQDRFGRAELRPGDEAFQRTVAEVVAFVERPERGLSLPLDVQGTAFQERVWRALRDIPAGQTASYADVARRIGAPGAVRAVAQACGANPVAVAIPCHRVVRQDGALSGYHWGVERKRALLDREGA